MQIDVDRQPKRRSVGTTGKLFPGNRMPSAILRLLGEAPAGRVGQMERGNLTDRPSPSIVLVARPLGAFQTSENLINWVSKLDGLARWHGVGGGSSSMAPVRGMVWIMVWGVGCQQSVPHCLCMKINLNAGHKAVPAWFPINALRAHPSRWRIGLAVESAIKCDLRMCGAV